MRRRDNFPKVKSFKPFTVFFSVEDSNAVKKNGGKGIGGGKKLESQLVILVPTRKEYVMNLGIPRVVRDKDGLQVIAERELHDIKTMIVSNLCFKQADYVRTVHAEWNELMSEKEVRALMSKVPENTDDGAIIMDSVREKIEEHVNAMTDEYDIVYSRKVGKIRRNIITFFNNIFFSGVELLPMRWWWENNFRLKKLLVVSLSLEGINLMSFTPTPTLTIMDIPQALVEIAKYISVDVQKHTEQMTVHHVKMCKEHVPYYCKIYTGE